MRAFFTGIFDTRGFTARWRCGNFSDLLGWTHIVADLLIFAAYAAIPLAIAVFVFRRKDVAFPKLSWLFAAFILSCGIVHLVEASLFYWPWYRFSGVLKLLTAVTSWATVIGLVRQLPRAVALPGVKGLEGRLGDEIEERLRAEEKVRRLNRDLAHRVGELEALLEVLPIGVGIAKDPNGRDIRTNRAFAELLRIDQSANASLGAPPGEAPIHFRVLHQGRVLAPDELPIQVAAAQNKIVRDFEEEVLFDDGRSVHVLGYAAPLHDDQGNVRGAVGGFVDITARRQAEDDRRVVEGRLQEIQKVESLGILAGGVAHDFNNLLTGIMGNAGLARLEVSDDSPTAPYLDQIEKASTRAADLCRQMLAYSGRGRFMIKTVDIGELIDEAVGLVRRSFLAKVRVVRDFGRGIPKVRVDPTQIEQVIMNLLINAGEAIGEREGEILVRTRRLRAERGSFDRWKHYTEMPEGDYVQLEVVDQGCGMTPDILARVFDPFFSTKFTGRGLGLAAVLGIVRGHKGAIAVESEVGRGTMFRVALPAVKDDVADQRSVPTTSSPFVGRGRILVVDDEETSRDVTSRMLSTFGFETTSLASGVEAVELLRADPQRFGLVILDLTMPVMDGVETFHALRKIAPDLRVILMSGYNEQEALQRFSGQGLAAFIQKPFKLPELRELLRSVAT
jgi:two-component system cell cycle sensor histidine kinase/response regulator CckA